MRCRRNLGVFCLAIFSVLLLVGCGAKKSDDTQSSAKTKTAEKTEATISDVEQRIADGEYAALIHVKINPELNVYLAEDGSVLAIECLNDDAKKAYGQLTFEGKTLDETMKTLVTVAADEGYLTEDKTVALNVVKCDAKLPVTDMTSQIQTSVQEAMTAKEITAEVSLEVAEEILEEQQVTLEPPKAVCTNCGGSGDCPDCDGGRMMCPACGGDGIEECGNCFGTGLDHGHTCTFCGGGRTHTCTHCGGAGTAKDCPVCGGSFKCVVCGGSGTL